MTNLKKSNPFYCRSSSAIKKRIFGKGKSRKAGRYGWVPDLPDQRDLFFFFRPKAVLPKFIDLREQMPPVYDQMSLGSCVSNGVAAVSQFLWKKSPEGDRIPSRLFIYYNGRIIEDCVNEDGGLMIRDAIKAVVKYGECLESEWPYDESKFAVKPNKGCYSHALTHKVLVYKRISSSIQDMRQCLADGNPIVFGATLYESFEAENVTKTGVVKIPEPNEKVVGGHAMVIVGYDDHFGHFIVRNSWGESWGFKGHCFIPQDYLTNPNLCDDRWTISKIR